ncbi:MAG TPA: TolC family protein, partial [Methyloversatilis sp.]
MFPTLRRSLPTLGAVVLFSLPLTACMVGPDYRKPDTTTTTQFRAAPAVAARDAGIVQADLARWWAGFKDPVLDRVIARALAQNLDLAAAAARVEQAHERLGAR